jgi:hypothetical protein
MDQHGMQKRLKFKLLVLAALFALVWFWSTQQKRDVAVPGEKSEQVIVSASETDATRAKRDAAPNASEASTPNGNGVEDFALVPQDRNSAIVAEINTVEALLKQGAIDDRGVFGRATELLYGCKNYKSGDFLQGFFRSVREGTVLDTPEGRASANYLDGRKVGLCAQVSGDQAQRYFDIAAQLIERANNLRSRTAQALTDDPEFDYRVAGSQTGLTEAQQYELSAQHNAASEKHDKALIGLVFDNSDLSVVSEALWKMGRMETWRLFSAAFHLRGLGTGTLVLPHNRDRRGPRIFELSALLIACGYHPDVCGPGRYRVISMCTMTHSCTPTLTLEAYLAARYHPNDILVAKDFVQQIMLERARRKTVTFPLLH